MEVEEIQRRARKAPIILLTRRAISLIVSLTATVLIARLVGPRAYGLAAMSNVIFSLGEMFRDFGLTKALMRKGDIQDDEVSFLFWFNVAVTLLIACIIGAGASFIAKFYHEPTVTWVILVAIIGFIVGGFTMQHQALLNRDLRFTELAFISTFGMISGFAVSLVLAFVRHDVWALVWGNVATSIFLSAGTMIVSRWMPGPPRLIPELRSILAFGANTSVYSFSLFLSANGPVLLTGHFLNASALGQYNRAATLIAMPIANIVEPISQAVLPVMARLRKHPVLYRQEYLKLVEMLCMVLMPTSIILIFSSVPLVETVLGARWAQAGMILAILAPTLGASGLSYAVSDLFISQDRSTELRNIGIREMVVRMGGILIGLHFGVLGAAAGWTLSTLLIWPVRMALAGRRGPVTLYDQVKASAPAAIISAWVGLGCAAGFLLSRQFALAPMPSTLLIIGSGAGIGLTLGLSMRRCRHAIARLCDTLHIPRLSQVLVGREVSIEQL